MARVRSTPSSSHVIDLAIGVDVAKDEIVVAHQSQVRAIANTRTALTAWLHTLPCAMMIGVEATNSYHQLLADLAHAAGHTVFVLNPQALKHYRTAISGRAKTDVCDAQLIARYLTAEHSHLHSYQPLSPALRKLSGLIQRRATLVKTKTQLQLSLGTEAEALGLKTAWKAHLRSCDHLLKQIDRMIGKLLQQPELQEKSSRLLGIIGIGNLTAAALLSALERGEFANADAFVAFLGLDPTPRDSGQSNGRRRLSKKGNSELRRLLFNASRSASLTKLWSPIYQRYLKRGLKATQVHCILARKLARIAWSLYKHGTTFCPLRLVQAPGIP